MTTPLVAIRAGKHGPAVIANAQPQQPAAPTAPVAPATPVPSATTQPVTFRGRPSRVLLLRNMATAQEATTEADSLCSDVGTECNGKYGEVNDVRVHVVPGAPGADADVRVFVRFGKQSSAMRAYVDLEGRFFNERQLAVWFFSEAAFDAKQLDAELA
jgi:hypothetical protein